MRIDLGGFHVRVPHQVPDLQNAHAVDGEPTAKCVAQILESEIIQLSLFQDGSPGFGDIVQSSPRFRALEDSSGRTMLAAPLFQNFLHGG